MHNKPQDGVVGLWRDIFSRRGLRVANCKATLSNPMQVDPSPPWHLVNYFGHSLTNIRQMRRLMNGEPPKCASDTSEYAAKSIRDIIVRLGTD